MHHPHAARSLTALAASVALGACALGCSALDFSVGSLPSGAVDAAASTDLGADVSTVTDRAPVADRGAVTDRPATDTGATVRDAAVAPGDVPCVGGCRGGEACAGGQCVVTCGSERVRCGAGSGGCVDLRSNEDHCGACGRACASGDECCRGVCRSRCD